MQNVIISIIESFSYFGVMFLIALENIFPPIPSEIILLFSGFITTYMNINLILMIIFSTLGSLIGTITLYYLGSILNKERLKILISGKVGTFLGLKEEDVEKATNWFENRGYKAVFYCRFVPIVRSLISIPAGINKMNIIKFCFYSSVGALIWNTALLMLGNKVGENWFVIADIVDKYALIILISLILFSITLITRFYFKRIKKNSD